MTNKDDGMRRIQSLVKQWLDTVESTSQWKLLPRTFVKIIRTAIIRTAWSAYKVGLVSREHKQTHEEQVDINA